MDQSRQSPRIATEISALLIDAAGGEYPVTVIDLSSGGFRFRCDRQFLSGEQVRLRVDHGIDYPAIIEWALPEEAGGSFLEPVGLVDDVPT